MLPTSGQQRKRGAARGRSRKGPAGFALLAGATGLFMKNRAKRRRGDSSTRAR